MTATELRNHFSDTYGLNNEWPKTFDVDHETYANVCQFLFKYLAEYWPGAVHVSIGPNYGVMFKNVELILVEKR